MIGTGTHTQEQKHATINREFLDAYTEIVTHICCEGLWLVQVCTSDRINSVVKSIVFQFLCYENTVSFFFSIRISISSFKSLLEKSWEILPTCTQI